jgi:hypothetical protein
MYPGYTLKITFHRAEDLPVADFGSFSSDPYISAHMVDRQVLCAMESNLESVAWWGMGNGSGIEASGRL